MIPSIVAVPAVGANLRKSWAGEDTDRPWLISEVLKRIPNARVLLYDHGKPSAHDDLDSLAHRLLNRLHEERLRDVGHSMPGKQQVAY